MHVVATAGHVDHGKSTLVRALTGMEPDRYAEEQRRGMTIDLGYVWTRFGAQTVAFVDVPGHERFLGTMLAGLGPAPAVVFVVAADEGWREQSEQHLAAVDALDVRHGLLVVTRSDLADPTTALRQARARLRESSLGNVAAVTVSAVTGQGLDELRDALGRLVAELPAPRASGRVRFWVDRSFTIRGAGTVVTGTHVAGTLEVGDVLALGERTVRIRGLQSLGSPQQRVPAVARVALNLRGVEVVEVGRGDALLTPQAWSKTAAVDVRCLRSAASLPELPVEVVAHLGTAAVPARLRPLAGDLARLNFARPLPVEVGDRLVLRNPGRHAVAAGALVLDPDPPALTRRGAAAERARRLRAAESDPAAQLVDHVRRRGAVRRADLLARGISIVTHADVREVGEWLVDEPRWFAWRDGLLTALGQRERDRPLDPRLPVEEARQRLHIPDRTLVLAVARAAGLQHADGRLFRSGSAGGLGAAVEAGLAELERRLVAEPFVAPEKDELTALGLGVAELAAAERLGRLVRLTAEVVLLPTGPALAMRVLAGLPQPFTTAQARQALGTTRRVAVPLLEHLDRRGWTVRLDAGHRRVRQA